MYKVDYIETKDGKDRYRVKGPLVDIEINLAPDPKNCPEGMRQGDRLSVMLQCAYDAGKQARSDELMELLKG